MGDEQGGAGRRTRLSDVAAHAGVSTATVSLVLRESPGPSAATRERVLASAAALRYRPDRAASLLARRRAHLLGVVMDVRSPFHAELVDYLHDAADDCGYELLLSTVTARHGEPQAVETLADSRCEALVLLGPTAPTRWLAEVARALPLVVVGRRIAAPDVDVVRSADDVGVRLAVEHLAADGHRDIAYVDGGRGTIAADRRRGYRTALRRLGLADRDRVLTGDETEAAGSAAAAALLTAAAPMPTAVVAFNDRSALGLLDAFLRAGVAVPGDVSVVGYDDSHLAQLAHVDLTSVSQETRRQAEQAVAAAVERLDGGRTARREVVLPPRLVVRATTAPPPARRRTSAG
jgi:DNA-binding LacI/PurR family transcriptional regulator